MWELGAAEPGRAPGGARCGGRGKSLGVLSWDGDLDAGGVPGDGDFSRAQPCLLAGRMSMALTRPPFYFKKNF